MKFGLQLASFFALVSFSVCGQGTFVYDQQSSANETPPPLGAGGRVPVSPGTGTGQSFTPSLSSVGFIRLMLDDGDVVNSGGATVLVNLRSGSITGLVIGTSASVHMFNGFSGPATFLFPSPISVAPGTTYFIEAVQQIGTSWDMYGIGDTYPGGSAWNAGAPTAGDLWFREGIVVPEPSSAALLVVVGGGVWITRRRMRL